MTIRVSQLTFKASITAVGNLQVAQVNSKAVITGGGDLRVAQIVSKAVVRTYKITRIKKAIPPVPLTLICGCNPVCCFTYG